MYLKKSYQHSKPLFLCIVLFALLQLINNIRQDIALSPVYSYGMYSQKIMPQHTYNIPEIFVNGKHLQTENFTPQQWDNISLPVTLFYEQASWNKMVWQEDIYRLLPFADSVNFLNNLTEADFMKWYKAHLEIILNKKIASVNINFNKYNFNGARFTKASM